MAKIDCWERMSSYPTASMKQVAPSYSQSRMILVWIKVLSMLSLDGRFKVEECKFEVRREPLKCMEHQHLHEGQMWHSLTPRPSTAVTVFSPWFVSPFPPAEGPEFGATRWIKPSHGSKRGPKTPSEERRVLLQRRFATSSCLSLR